jgi:hypothetical protein
MPNDLGRGVASSRRLVVPLLIAGGVAMSGCGGADDAAVRSVATRFLDAVSAGDGAAACELLSPQTRSQLEQTERRQCRAAVTGVKLERAPVARVRVYVQNAIVELAGGEAAFLEQGSEGWRVSAAGCMPHGSKPADHPYDCELED